MEILEQIASLMTAGFGLVAALAWNEAIQDLFAAIFPKPNLWVEKFIYAILITTIVVIFTAKIGNAIGKIKEKINKDELK